MIIVQRKGKTILYDDNGHIAYFGENKHIAMSIKKNMEQEEKTTIGSQFKKTRGD